MILNVRPASLPELDVVIEEVDARLGNEKMEEVLQIIRSHLGERDEDEPMEESQT
jgi:hypothetical protein